MNLFISGHSLVDQPFPDHLASIARSCGTPLDWNRQYMVGSSIRERTRGLDASNPSWVGYRGGIDRHDQPIDVLAELREPRGIEAGTYDVLLITEQHGLLGTLVWNDTVPMLRHFHDQFIGANPGGSTYFYESWLGINDKNDPRRWIDYERAASPIWQCVVTRVNQSLAQEGRADRIISVPVGLALAELICAATTGTGLEHVTRGSVRQTVDGLIHDDVHATKAASYFVAAVTYAAIFRRSPEGAAPPASVAPELAHALRRFAWSFVSSYYAGRASCTLEGCDTRAVLSFNALYWDYVYDAIDRRELGPIRARVRWLRQRIGWHRLLSRQDRRNPLFFDPADDLHSPE
jgi:hypothetical protein